MGYLDSAGLTHFWEKVKTILAGKQDALTVGDGITIQGDTISVATPVKGLTQAEYDALSEEEKMSGALYITSQSDYSPPDRGGTVPTGTVISFLGLTAPDGYLTCDGAQYEIAEYAGLALFIQGQFGTKNYFGGDGTTTFAVPDMRNLFLRGYHSDAPEQLSGDIGVKQDGTAIPNLYGGPSGIAGIGSGNREALSQDSALTKSRAYDFQRFTSDNGWETLQSASNNPVRYTTRPVNMAVLYCIKT